MRKLKSQFGTLQKNSVTLLHGCCCSCCCIASVVAFSLATSRYLYVKADEYNNKNTDTPVSVAAFALYGLLFYVIGLALAFGAAVYARGPNQAFNVYVAISVGIHLVIAGFVYSRIKLHPLLPLLLGAVFVSVAVGEVFVWMTFMK